MSQANVSETQQPSPLVALQIRFAGAKPQLVIIDHDGFEIGGSEQCDLCLPHCGLPKLHSILHVQGGAVWIEMAHEGAVVSIDGESYRRRALRDGDEILIGNVPLTVHIGTKSVDSARPIPEPHLSLEQRLSRLTAEELCDLIELEESQTRDFERRRQMGLKALLSAVHDVVDADADQPQPSALPQVAAISDDRFDELVAQIRGLSDTLDERTRELAAQETLLLESSSQLVEAQRRVNRQLEQLIERIAPEENPPGELRVSA
jgi:predicted component of type VI protein secretion system